MPFLPGDHPLTRAAWIWPEGYMYLHNHFAQFRLDFDIPELPAAAPLAITADKAYRLYVNGHYVCRGPARGYQSHWPFDEVDVRACLKQGHNWFAVEAYTPGISTFQYLHQTKAGFLCAAEWGNTRLYTGTAWQMRRAPGHNHDTARLSMQLDFQEDWDAAADDRSWITSETPPSNWNPDLFPEAGQNINIMPFGQPPWESVEPRGIPMLSETLMAPAAITGMGTGDCLDQYQRCHNISWHCIEKEWSTVKAWANTSGIPVTHSPTSLEFAVEPTGAG